MTDDLMQDTKKDAPADQTEASRNDHNNANVPQPFPAELAELAWDYDQSLQALPDSDEEWNREYARNRARWANSVPRQWCSLCVLYKEALAPPVADLAWHPVESFWVCAACRDELFPNPADMDSFLDSQDPEYDWLVPGLLERGDRLMLTGPEGKGKSTLLRQIGVRIACGMHPFAGDQVSPVKVLFYDLENSESHFRREMRKLRLAAGERWIGANMKRVNRPQGLDFNSDGGDILNDEVSKHKPDVLIVGPLYKMIAGDPNSEEQARPVALKLDSIRTEHGCAVLLEAHSPHASNGGKRPMRPAGWSGWMRWPEFGIHIDEHGAISHWRGMRDQRDFPSMLNRGGKWPWSIGSSPRDELWARIAKECDGKLSRPSERDLEKAIGAPKTRIHRAIEEHRTEWDKFPHSG
ncbi:AAA family ATPase [Streptomyces sp. B-S-A8]|uniref:AAA family ATPase n=1 Tax=Streptomyces solicavernae TaxID=3043614 RepID=A0ABT6RPL9_9ACTN|nr:AAA family ATPase [Streptomyces sp. B-S-A8]MDI3386359.1 AAA family ATPase [Streptomyces sp. B-S-A8]